MPKFYDIKAVGDEAVINIYGDIGFDWWAEESNDAKSFIAKLDEVNASMLTVRLNSYGGSVSDGIAIYNAIKRHPAFVKVDIGGVAFSIASLIAMAGDEVNMAENALLMIHAPWGALAGNAVELREYADVLDKYADAMATSYMTKSGKSKDEIDALLKDGADHYFTAAEALAEGYIDRVSDAVQIAASAVSDRYSLPAAWVAANHLKKEEKPMSVKDKDTAASQEPVAVANEPVAKPVDEKAVLAAEKQRREGIRATFKSFESREGVKAVLDACLDDPEVTPHKANERLLAHLGSQVEPLAGTTDMNVGKTDSEKFVDGATKAILARGGIGKREAGNEFNGLSMMDMARASLDLAGVSHRGMDKMQVVGAAFTMSTSDFPVLLENVMHKTLLEAYKVAPDTWSRFCKVGNLSDFRAHNRYRAALFGNLDDKTENNEFKHKSISDAAKESITLGTKGNIVALSREMIINDDLGGFMDMLMMMGRGAKRTLESGVYTYLESNPTMSDGVALFHADHGNLAGSGAAVSQTTISAARQAMAAQTDVSGVEYLDIVPSIFVGGIAAADLAREVNGMEFNDETSKNQRRPNLNRGLFNDVIGSPRVSGTPWYMFADPMDAPVLEVGFLDGNQDPYLEVKEGFTQDGALYKVRLDYGIAAIGWEGAYKNAGS